MSRMQGLEPRQQKLNLRTVGNLQRRTVSHRPRKPRGGASAQARLAAARAHRGFSGHSGQRRPLKGRIGKSLGR